MNSPTSVSSVGRSRINSRKSTVCTRSPLRRTVIYISEKVSKAFIFHGDGGVEVFAPSKFDDYALDLCELPSTVLIADGGTAPPICAA